MSSPADHEAFRARVRAADASTLKRRRIAAFLVSALVALPMAVLVTLSAFVFKPSEPLTEPYPSAGLLDIVIVFDVYAGLGLVSGMLLMFGFANIRWALTLHHTKRRTIVLVAVIVAVALLPIPGGGGVEGLH